VAYGNRGADREWVTVGREQLKYRGEWRNSSVVPNVVSVTRSQSFISLGDTCAYNTDGFSSITSSLGKTSIAVTTVPGVRVENGQEILDSNKYVGGAGRDVAANCGD